MHFNPIARYTVQLTAKLFRVSSQLLVFQCFLLQSLLILKIPKKNFYVFVIWWLDNIKCHVMYRAVFSSIYFVIMFEIF